MLTNLFHVTTIDQRKLQEDIEQAGSQVIDRVAEMDQAAQKLELQREKVERSKFKLQLLTNKLASQHDTMKQRECDLRVLVLHSFSQRWLSRKSSLK